MTGKENSTQEIQTLRLVASPSPDLAVALTEFIRPPLDERARSIELGKRAITSLPFVSFQMAEFTPPKQIERGLYGEGDGVTLGRYTQSLNLISRSKIDLSDDENASGIDERGRLWVTLQPSNSVKETIVQPPLYPRNASEEADLRMYFTVPERLQVTATASAIALNSLRVLLAHDKEQYAERDEKNTRTRKMFATNLHIHKSPKHTPPAPSQQLELPDAA